MGGNLPLHGANDATPSAVAVHVGDKAWVLFEIESSPAPSCQAVVRLQWAGDCHWEQQIMLLLSGKVLFA